MKIKLLLFFVLCSTITFAQKKVTISGYITDANTGEALINASVFEVNTYRGVTTNNYGFYSLTLPASQTTIAFSYVGYRAKYREIILNENKRIDIALNPKQLEEVKVVAKRADDKVTSSQMSKVDIPIEKIQNLPAFLGEADVIKTLQLLPGVQSGTEGSSGLYVRGGGPDQNLLLLDGVPVYNANHLFGFFSVFNPNAIKNVSLYKGGFPARFGGRLSSVVDIRMKEGNMKEYHGKFSVGLISSNFNFEGPIAKDKTAFNISARRTYADLLARPFMKSKERGGFYFYDLNAKINHKFNDRSRIYLSAYLGSDVAHTYSEEAYNSYNDIDKSNMNWGNTTTALRWNYIFNEKLFSNTTLTYSKYTFKVGLDEKEYKLKDLLKHQNLDYTSHIEDIAYKQDFDYFPNPNHAIKFGLNYIYHHFKPGVKTLNKKDGNTTEFETQSVDDNKKAHEVSAYIEDDFSLGARLKMNLGLHLSGFNVDKSFYTSIEPRASLRYMLSNKVSLKAAYSKMQQYIHLLSNSTISLPTDLWLPVTKKVKPMKSEQFAVGAVYQIQKGVNFSLEGFYKKMDNLIAYKEGASFFGGNRSWEDKVEIGKGWSYGVEALLSKEVGKTTGWIGYTLSWADRQFENLNFGEKFPARYDRRHDISIALTHKFNKRIDIGATWVYGTGNALTVSTHIMRTPSASGSFKYGSGEANFYGKRNNYRMSPYHRLDLGINFHKQKKHGIRTWNISIYNAYSRQNPFFLYFEEQYKSGTHQSRKQLKQVSLFPIVPSITYSYKF
ncbi:TonB-dependent receptor [Prolixibacteraceae bacterium JC049]|nr:TonB-dependent receptor [Prolixibacteraceae bacterium JC049]